MFSAIQTSLLNSIHFVVGWLLTFVFSLLSLVFNASPLESSPPLIKQSRARRVRSLSVSSDASSRSPVISSIFSDFDALSSPSSSGLSTPTSFISCPLPSSLDLNKAFNKVIMNSSSQTHISSAVVKYQPTSLASIGRTSRTFVYSSSSKTYQVGLSRRETSLHI